MPKPRIESHIVSVTEISSEQFLHPKMRDPMRYFNPANQMDCRQHRATRPKRWIIDGATIKRRAVRPTAYARESVCSSAQIGGAFDSPRGDASKASGFVDVARLS